MLHFETVRTFAALNIEVAGVRRIALATERLRSDPKAPPVRWVPPTRMHVTLKFFGEIDAGLAPTIRDGLATLAAASTAPRLAFSGFSAFPSLEKASVVFAEVDDMGGETASLAAAVDNLGEALGLRREARPYHPHLTVARTKESTPVHEWLIAQPPWRVVALAPEIVLYRSEFAQSGGEYGVLGRFCLGPRKSNKRQG